MHLSEIWVYPVKSLGGIRLAESKVEEKGLQYDRRWMIVDQNGKFLTQRINHKMALIQVAFQDENLILSYQNASMNQALVPFVPVNSMDIRVRIWKDEVTARTVSDEADAWLSEQLGKNVRIVEMPESARRVMNDPQYIQPANLVSFADDFPYLLISEASLQDLNSRLSEPVGMNRFRPNFIIADTEPYAEDQWKYIRIGNTEFDVAKPCERCVLTTVDPESGIKGTEPLKTLSTYRKEGTLILFGQNMVAKQFGTVSEGDSVTVLRSTGSGSL